MDKHRDMCSRVTYPPLVIPSDFVCVHKSTCWNVVDARVHQQFYCVSCGGINNLIWIFSLHFDIRCWILFQFECIEKDDSSMTVRHCVQDRFIYYSIGFVGQLHMLLTRFYHSQVASFGTIKFRKGRLMCR